MRFPSPLLSLTSAVSFSEDVPEAVFGPRPTASPTLAAHPPFLLWVSRWGFSTVGI